MIDKKKHIKILYVITLSTLGGAQVHLRDLISFLPQYIIPYVAVGEKGWLYNTLENKMVDIHHIKNLVQPLSVLKDIYALLELYRLVKDIKPDLIHCHSSKAGFLGRIVGKVCGIPTVFTAHGWAFTEGVSPPKRVFYKTLERMAAKWTKKIICVSEYDRQLGIVSMPESKEKLVTIHNGIVDLEDITGHFNKYTADKLKLVMVARFSPPKNQCLLLEALAELKNENIHFDTIFIGDGPCFGVVQKMAEELGLSANVKFLGARLDVASILSLQDVFVLTSNWEGFPISILEAMRQSLPLIASNVGGVCEAVIDSHTGFLIERNDKETLIQRLREFHYNRELCYKMGMNGRQQFEKNFTIENMERKTICVYEDVINA